jgi:hypothetical protein
MNGLEIYKIINGTLQIIVWPITLLIIIIIFRRVIFNIINRFIEVEGKVGDISFKITLEKLIKNTVNKALELEKEGKTDEIREIVKNAGELAAGLYDLTEEDVNYLIYLYKGDAPKRRWGKVNLVRAGLVELDGGKLTEDGRKFIEDLGKVKSFEP